VCEGKGLSGKIEQSGLSPKSGSNRCKSEREDVEDGSLWNDH
jgi:hypothetical protein